MLCKLHHKQLEQVFLSNLKAVLKHYKFCCNTPKVFSNCFSSYFLNYFCSVITMFNNKFNIMIPLNFYIINNNYLLKIYQLISDKISFGFFLMIIIPATETEMSSNPPIAIVSFINIFGVTSISMFCNFKSGAIYPSANT